MMKILLINPPAVRIRYNISGIYPTPPLGLAYIAAVLEKNNFCVQVLDMPATKISIKGLRKYLEHNRYSIYGLSCNIFNFSHGLKISGVIKNINPEANVVLGGPCTIFPPEVILKYGQSIDIVVKNEGEEPMLEICQEFKKNKSLDNFEHIPGISYRHNNRIFTNRDASYADLNRLPFPKRELLPNRYYKIHPPFGLYPPFTLMETNRGCPYRCSFCSLAQPLRERSVDNVVEEIKEVIKKFRIKEIYFTDSTFTYNRERILNLCNKILENNIKVAWTCRTRVDLVSADLLKTMSQAGCYTVSYGIESGSQEFLNQFNKDITIECIKNAFQWSKEAKIRTIAYIILDSSLGSDVATKETLDLIKSIKPDFVLYSKLLLKPNSSLGEELVTEGKLNYDDLIRLYIGGKKLPKNKSIFRLYISFYFDLKYIFYRLINLKNTRDLFNLVKGARLLIFDRLKSKDIFDR